MGRRVYGGRGMTNDDLAVIAVDRGNVHSFSSGTPTDGERVEFIGFPESMIARASQGSSVHPRSLPGYLSASLVDGRELLDLRTEPGDSGGPVFDGAYDVVGVLQGKQDAENDIAVGASQVKSTIANVQAALAANPDPDATRAYLLYLNARAFDREAVQRSLDGISSGVPRLESSEDALFGEAIAAQSIDAARAFVSGYPVRVSGGYTPSAAVLAKAIALLEPAAQRGNGAAAFALYQFYDSASASTTVQAVHAHYKDESSDYLQLAVQASYPYALDEYANEQTNTAQQAALRLRALSAYVPLIRHGDADAAENYATDYSLLPAPASDVAAFQTWEQNAAEDELRAARMGSPSGVIALLQSSLPTVTPEMRAEAFDQAKALAPHDADMAQRVASAYASRTGVTQDPLVALDYYAMADSYPPSSGSALEQRIEQTVPGGLGYTAKLATSAQFRRDRNAIVILHMGTENQDDQTQVGVVVGKDRNRIVIATASAALGCDAYNQNCLLPHAVQFPGIDATMYPVQTSPSALLYATGTGIESGVSLLQVRRAGPGYHLPDVAVANVEQRIPDRIYSIYQLHGATVPHWGITRGATPSLSVFRYDLPTQGFNLGTPIFDSESGALVGLVTDPDDALHAAGPSAIVAVLRLL